MTSVEKRRSGRKSSRRRKHSNGALSDASSTGSFLDETDREVSNLTDRAFRSLCIGDEAVYNDSDLCSSSPCFQSDTEGGFRQTGQEREELKRAAHESFSLWMQQYGQDWVHRGMYWAQVHKDPQWEAYGESAQLSATFQHAFMDASQQEAPLMDKQPSFQSNGAAESGLQQSRSRSRVSDLIRAFNSEGHVDGAEMEGKVREWNEETLWDKASLMGIQRDLTEFPTASQHLDRGHFPSGGAFSSKDSNFYCTDTAAVAHISTESPFLRKHSMSTQANCNSNFFIHSEFSPFKAWKDRNRFPFQQGEVSGFLNCSEFSKWYETPMYKKLSLESQRQGCHRLEERGIRSSRNNLPPIVPPTAACSTSTYTTMQKALAVEKRCESESARHYRKGPQRQGANRLPPHRPSTASPTTEMSRRIQDAGSYAYQQKPKMMTEQNITNVMSANKQEGLRSNNNSIPYDNNVNTHAPNAVSSKASTAPFSISQLLTPFAPAHEEVETSKHAVSPQPVEHPPVCAESRGATPDVRPSSYKSRATSLLFNLKDNRKRVKSTYSPTKFKGSETSDKNKQTAIPGPRDTVIDIPDIPDPDIQFVRREDSSRTTVVPHQYVKQQHSPGFSLTNSQPATAHGGLYSEYSSGDYQPTQIQGEMVHHAGFTALIAENCTSNQVANGQNPYEDLVPFTPYKQGMMDNVEKLGGDVNRLKPFSTATETINNQSREYLISKTNTEQHFNETVGRESTAVKHNYSNVSSQSRWKQANNQDTENISVKTTISPWKQERAALMEKDKHAQAYERATAIKEELHLPRDKYSRENQQSINKETEKTELRESFGDPTSLYKNPGLVNFNISNQVPQYAQVSNSIENPAYYGQPQYDVFEDKPLPPKYSVYKKENEIIDNHLKKNYYGFDQEVGDQQNLYLNKDKNGKEADRRESTPKESEIQSLQAIEAKPQFKQEMLKTSLSVPDNTSAPTVANQAEHRQFVEVKAEEDITEYIKVQHAQTELANPQNRAPVDQPAPEMDRIILAEQAGSVKVKAEQTKTKVKECKRVNQEKTGHIKDKDIKEEQVERAREQQSDQGKKEQTDTEQTRVHTLTEEPKHVTKETEVKHTREPQGEQAEGERLKEEHLKTEPAENEQTRIKQAETEEAKRVNIKAGLVGVEQLRGKELEKARVEPAQSRTENDKAKRTEAELRAIQQVTAELTKEQQGKEKDDCIQECQVHAERPTTQKASAHKENGKQPNVAQTKTSKAKVELANAEKMPEMSAKLEAKLRVSQQVKSEPDRVERVKTELAKAKAELAKIKEKMRVDQKKKARNATPTKDDAIKKHPLKLDKNDEHQYHEQATQKNQQDSVSRQSTNQVKIGGDAYVQLTETSSKNKLSAVSNVSSDDDNKTTSDKSETMNDEEKNSPRNGFASANTENKEEVGIFKSKEVTENHYVYSESSQEFKLSPNDYLPTNTDRANLTDKVDNSVEECDSLKHNDSKHRDNVLALERRPKSTEHSLGPGNDPHLTPPRALSHKERAQTKQEILTSKIKAHAEKEISAIKERGFAKPDGFLSKAVTKQWVGSQRPEAQRPPSQELSNKHESASSSNTLNLTEPLVRSATVPLPQKQVHKEPMKSNSRVSKTPGETKGRDITAAEEGLEDQQKENVSGIKSPMQNEEQTHKSEQRNGEPRERIKDNSALTTNHISKEEEEVAEAKVPVEAESPKTVTTEKVPSDNERVNEDTSPSVTLVFGENEAPVADHCLKIEGVRARTPCGSNEQRNNSTEEKRTKETESSYRELDEYHPSPGGEMGKDKPSTMKDDQTKADMNNHGENVQETSDPEIRKNTSAENVPGKDTNPQLVDTSRNARPHGETQFQEPLTEKGVSFTPPPKNNSPAETESHLYTQDTVSRETQDYTKKTTNKKSTKNMAEEKIPQQNQAEQTNENLMAKMANTEITYTDDSKSLTLLKRDSQSSFKEDRKMVTNPPKSINICGKQSPLLEEKRHDTVPPVPLSKSSPSNHLTTEHDNKTGEEKNEENVHIDGIVMRGMPAGTEDSLNLVGKHVAVCSDAAATSGREEKDNVFKDEDNTKDVTPKSSKKERKDSCDEKYGNLLSSVNKLPDSLKVSKQEHSANTTKPENGKQEEVIKTGKSMGESQVQVLEGDYFELQGTAETNIKPHESPNVETSAPGLNKAAISDESHGRGKNEVFDLDQGKMKTVRSSSLSAEDENTDRKSREKSWNLVSKQSDSPTESNKNDKADVGQSVRIAKQHTKNQLGLLARETQSSHNHVKNTVKEKPEVKPRTKERGSTIPEISAIADYARLKVIVSEDQENPIQEFPPHKKEGFFPLIQSRHSRRPVFTADPQPLPAKEKGLPNKTEVTTKVNKEPKPLVFPIMDKEHQRTGMFKLGEKERQEKMLLSKHAQPLKDRHKSPTNNVKIPGSDGQGTSTNTQKVCQAEQLNHPPSSSEVNTSVTQQIPSDNSYLQGPPDEFSSKTKALPYLDHNSQPHPVVRSLLKEEEHKQTTVTQDDKMSENTLTGEDRPEVQRLQTSHEETTTKEKKANKLEGVQTVRTSLENTTEELKIKQTIEERRASLAEDERRASRREEERRAQEREAVAIQIKQRRGKQREAERRAEEERKAKQTEEERDAQKEEEMRTKDTVKTIKEAKEKRRIKTEEKLREEKEWGIKERREVKCREKERAVEEEQQRRATELDEQQRRMAQKEKQRRAAELEEQQRRAAKSEQQRTGAKEVQQQQITAAKEEPQRRAAWGEQRRRAAKEEQQRRASELEEQQRRAAKEEQQKRAAELQEQQRRAAKEEQQRRLATEEQQKRAAELQEQQRRAAKEEQQRRLATEEQQKRAAELQDQQRRAAKEEQQRRLATEEQQKRAAELQDQQRNATEKEQQMRAVTEDQLRRAVLMAEQRHPKQKTFDTEEEYKTKQREEGADAQISEEEKNKQIQKKAVHQMEDRKSIRSQEDKEERTVQKEKTVIKQREGMQAKDEQTRIPDKSQDEKRVVQEQMLVQRQDEIIVEKSEEAKEQLATYRENERAAQMEEQKKAAQLMDALQYYTIASESEQKPRERQLCSPLPSPRRNHSSTFESTEDSHMRLYRPQAPPSPAPSLPRSNTSSPALGSKPSMFRVKDNTFRGSSFIKSVKPRFHKNFGEDFRVGSPMVSEKIEEEQNTMRCRGATPLQLDTGSNRLTAVKAYPSHDYSGLHHRPYSRKSISLDEDDSRSIISTMSEDVESFATSATDVADVRALYEYERPESSCSFSSDVCRSLGKPPAVPPKSEKALRRAKRLTTRRIKKEFSKAAAEQPLQEGSSVPSSSSNEVRSPSRDAVATPHFSPPFSLAHAPKLESSLSSSHTEHQSSHSFHASPHATVPITVPDTSPPLAASVSLPVASPHAIGPVSYPAAPKTIADVASSPTIHHASHPAPVTKYHVESSYPHSYPLTQRKVLQDIGSGQYFVVDVPVQVRTKTFFDPETGRYVQLNVRESAKRTTQPKLQQQQLQTQIINPQQQLHSPGKSYVLRQPCQQVDINSRSYSRSSDPVTVHQDQQPARENHRCEHPVSTVGQNSEEPYYNAEKTPYMDTVNDMDKTVYNIYESFPGCDTNSQLAGSSVYKNDSLAHSQYGPRDIITMSELEDFMELSDW